MKKTYIKPLCETIAMDSNATLLAGSGGNKVEPGSEGGSTDIDAPEYDNGEPPENAKYDWNYDIWSDDY